jgi:hypothetical protein
VAQLVKHEAQQNLNYQVGGNGLRKDRSVVITSRDAPLSERLFSVNMYQCVFFFFEL